MFGEIKNEVLSFRRSKSCSFVSLKKTKFKTIKKAARDEIELKDYYNCLMGEGEFEKY